MGHHIDSEGRFQSDRHPNLAPDKIVVSFKDRRARAALYALASSYQLEDRELSDDIVARLRTLQAEEEAADRRRMEAAAAPVDRSQRTLVGGGPVTADHRELKPNGQQKDYVVLSEKERGKGFVRPVRRTYTHEKCGAQTTMSQALAETYARDPGFYSGTFCVGCGGHFPVGKDGEFVWTGTDEKVGT